MQWPHGTTPIPEQNCSTTATCVKIIAILFLNANAFHFHPFPSLGIIAAAQRGPKKKKKTNRPCCKAPPPPPGWARPSCAVPDADGQVGIQKDRSPNKGTKASRNTPRTICSQLLLLSACSSFTRTKSLIIFSASCYGIMERRQVCLTVTGKGKAQLQSNTGKTRQWFLHAAAGFPAHHKAQEEQPNSSQCQCSQEAKPSSNRRRA